MRDITSFSTRALALAGCAILTAPIASIAQPLAAQDEATNRTAPLTEDKLYDLQDRAIEVFENSSRDAEGQTRVLAAWQDVEIAARAFDPDHPLVAFAQIKSAAALYDLGRNEEAQSAVEAGLAATPLDDPTTLTSRAQGVALLGNLLAQAGKAEAAIAALREGYKDYLTGFANVPEKDRKRGTHMAKSNLEFSLSQVLLRLSEVDDALAFQKNSLDTREGAFGPNDPDTIGSYYGYAGTLRRAGRMEEAERVARIAVDRAVDHLDPSHRSYARALEMLAIVLSRGGRPIEATDYLVRALELKREHEGADSLFFGYGIHLLATTFHQRERYAEAMPLFAEAAPIFARYQGEESPFGLGSLAYAGQGEFALGRTMAAVGRLDALYQRLGENSRDLLIIERIAPDLARGLKRLDRSEEAREVASSVIARQLEATGSDAFALRHMQLVEAWVSDDPPNERVDQAQEMLQYLRRRGVTDLGGFLQVEQRAALDLVMEIAVEAQDAELMVSAIALSSASGISRATQLRRERALAVDEELAQVIRAVQDADAALETADRAILAALASGEGVEDARKGLAYAAAAREAAYKTLTSGFPDWQADTLEATTSVASLRAQLSEAEAFVAFIPAYDGAYRLLVTPSQTQIDRIDAPRAQLVEWARQLRESAIAGSVDEGVARQLGEALLPATSQAALEGTRVLKVLAGGALASLPLPLIRIADESASADWLLDRYAVLNVTSLDSVDSPSGKTGASASFVAFAAPEAFGSAPEQPSVRSSAAPRSLATYFGRTGASAGALAALPALPGAAREAREMAARFDPRSSALFVGADAREERLSDERVTQADVLLFATHGLVAGEVEGIAEPALVLSPSGEGASDGVLTASEIARLDLSADWIILTACDSAAGFSGGLPAFSGLARAFRFAGGGSLLATHWRVRDDIAAYVAVEAVSHYRKNGDKALALQHAIRKLRTQSGLEGADRPELWAPFVLVD